MLPQQPAGGQDAPGSPSAGDRGLRDPEIQEGALEAAQILAHAGELSRGFVRDERKLLNGTPSGEVSLRQ